MKYKIKFRTRGISCALQRGLFLFSLLLAGAGISMAQDPFYLAHRHHQDMILQVANSSQSNGTPIVLGVRNDGKTAMHAQQAWYYDNTTQTIRLKANANKCIARKGQMELGDPIVLADVSAGSALQKWVIEGNRIKLASNKLLGITLGSQSFDANTPAVLGEVTALGTYDNWYVRPKPSAGLVADGQIHQINYPGNTVIDMYVPDPCPYPNLSIRLRGADGGSRIVSGTTKGKGGEGATISATFKIGTGTNEIKPGSNLRFIIGQHAENYATALNATAGGGGGTGVILETPGTSTNYTPWTMLMIAAGGMGAHSDCCAYHNDGIPAFLPSEGIGSGKEYNDVIQEEGGMYWPKGNTYRASSEDGGATGVYGCSGGYPRVNDFINMGGGETTNGGGYSASRSNINLLYCIPPYREVKNGITGNPINGYAEYVFSAEGPVSRGLYYEVYKGTEASVLKSGPWTLKWQYDGNLVLYQTGVAKWASNTANKGAALKFQGDGNLVIYQNGVGIWASNTANNEQGGKGGRNLYLTPFGELYMLNQDNKVVWKGH